MSEDRETEPDKPHGERKQDAEADKAGEDQGKDHDADKDDADQDDADQDDGDKEDGEKEDKPKLSARTKLILVIAAVIVLVIAAIWYIRHETRGKYYQATNDATIDADAVIVAPKVSGYIAQVLVADNQDVKAGQPLVRIDARDYQAKVGQAQAQVTEALASADSGRAGVAEQFATIEQTRAQLVAARTKAAHDAAEVARYAPLAASGAETREHLAQLRATAAQSAQDARAQAAALVQQQRHVESLRTQIRQGEARAQGARAQLTAADVDVGATLIRAAIDGRIGDRTATVGQYAQAGTRLMSVVPLTQLYVVANFKETQLALMRPGQPATIKVDALDGITLRGRVASVSPGTGAQFSLLPPQNATGNFTKIVQRVPVRIALEATPEARRLLVPGLSVNVTVDTISAKNDLDRLREPEKQAGNR